MFTSVHAAEPAAAAAAGRRREAAGAVACTDDVVDPDEPIISAHWLTTQILQEHNTWTTDILGTRPKLYLLRFVVLMRVDLSPRLGGHTVANQPPLLSSSHSPPFFRPPPGTV